MPLKSRYPQTTYVMGDNSLRLSASFAKLEALRDEVGQDPLHYVASMLEPLYADDADADVDGAIRRITTVLRHLQADEQHYERGELYDAFLSDRTAFFAPDNLAELTRVMASLLGSDISAKLAELDAQVPPETAQKKSGRVTTSTPSTSPSAT